MSAIGKHERHTQNRVIALFRNELKNLYSADKPKQSAVAGKLTEMDAELARCSSGRRRPAPSGTPHRADAAGMKPEVLKSTLDEH